MAVMALGSNSGDCVFPTATASFEPVHGVSGVKSGGHGLFLRNFFGSTIGYNDVVDFTGGKSQPPITRTRRSA